MPPAAHAKLSPSAAHRFLICTAAPNFEAQFPDTPSSYAEEGTLAHAVAEIYAIRWQQGDTNRHPPLPDTLLNHPLYSDEMQHTAAAWVDQLSRLAAAHSTAPSVRLEQRLDLSRWLPESFGTADCIMVSPHRITVADYKHGKGVRVDATENPQMRYYALGAIDRYTMLLAPGATVHTAIIQPRLDHVSEEEISADDLAGWGKANLARAAQAHRGPGEFVPGEHCRFCRGRVHCRARAEKNLTLEAERAKTTLSAAEIGAVLARGQDLARWVKDLEDYATRALLRGEAVEGWKLVEGRSTRAFLDPAVAIDTLRAAGYEDALLFDRRPKSLTALEGLLGKAAFAELLGGCVHRPPGKPTLAPASDKRPAMQLSAAADFEGVTPC